MVPPPVAVLFPSCKYFPALQTWASSQTSVIWILSVVYLLIVKFYPHRLPTVRHGLLPFWYFSVGLLQLVLLVAFLPAMVIVFSHGWTASVCRNASLYEDSYMSVVVGLFVVIKVVDLVETLLIITEGRNPLDLHVFHHIVTLLYVWHSYTQHSSLARWFIFTNLIAHVILYSYLSPWKFGIRPCWTMVAISQLASLIVCLIATMTGQRVLDAGGRCDVGYARLSLDKLVIAIFIIIFADFYHQKCREYRRRQEGGGVENRGRLLVRSSRPWKKMENRRRTVEEEDG